MNNCPVVLLHGYPFDRSLWFSTITSLGSAARVIAPDLPGFGKTPAPHKMTPSLELMAEAVITAMEEAGMKGKVIVVGMSMGGYVAAAFAEKYPERVAGLGLVSSQTAADTNEARKGREAMAQKILKEGPQAAAEAILPKMFAREEPKTPDLADYARKGAEKAGAEGLVFALQAMATRPDRTSFVENLSVPLLIVHGTEDRIVPIQRARELAERCQKPLYLEIRGAGHATPLEAPDQVASGIARLVKVCRQEQAAAAETAGQPSC